jgi:hypothetical protein
MNGTSFTEQSNNNGLETGIEHPHDHDVLSGRGNFVNYHAGNEHFRALVRKHKLNYVACPKPPKGKFSRVIVDEIRSRGGRFLKQDHSTKMWCEIGDKKALDKTRQALREGAPDILREIDPEDEDEGEVSQGMHSIHQVRRKNLSGTIWKCPCVRIFWCFPNIEQKFGFKEATTTTTTTTTTIGLETI